MKIVGHRTKRLEGKLGRGISVQHKKMAFGLLINIVLGLILYICLKFGMLENLCNVFNCQTRLPAAVFKQTSRFMDLSLII